MKFSGTHKDVECFEKSYQKHYAEWKVDEDVFSGILKLLNLEKFPNTKEPDRIEMDAVLAENECHISLQ